VILINLSAENQVISHGDRIAQMVFQKIEIVELESTDQISETARNAGGFGHTGIK
jgi:dUTP pyrophosphatase